MIATRPEPSGAQPDSCKGKAGAPYDAVPGASEPHTPTPMLTGGLNFGCSRRRGDPGPVLSGGKSDTGCRSQLAADAALNVDA